MKYCKDYGKVTFTRPFLMVEEVSCDEFVNVVKR